MQLNKHSKRVTYNSTQSAKQAMLFAVGLTVEDMKKPQLAIAIKGCDGNPCNMQVFWVGNISASEGCVTDKY
jgi:dihydroxy-acid dehydratase